MKKFIIILSAIVAFAVNVLAIPYTWVDATNITAGEDLINSLKHKLYDDGGNNDNRKSVIIDHPGIAGNEFYKFNYSNLSIGCSLSDLIQLTGTGNNVITISSVTNDSYHGNSHLTAYRNDVAPVPESSTMVLLGFGLLGIAIYGKRRINNEA